MLASDKRIDTLSYKYINKGLTVPAELAQSVAILGVIVGIWLWWEAIGCPPGAAGCPAVIIASTTRQKNMSFIKDILIWNVD